MVIDTSAIVAILQAEPEKLRFIGLMESADSCRVSVATWVEVSMVVESRFGTEGLRELDLFLNRAKFELIAVDQEQAFLARGAFSRFGKGRHPAGLNFGDCFSYALARVLGEPLLYKGADFTQTDVMMAEAA